MKRVITILVLGLGLVCASVAQAAQDYPVRPIRIITQAAPGSVIDTTTRQLATMLSAELGQSVLVSNHPGAGGNVAVNMLLAAPSDGYTLCTTGGNPFVDNFFLLDVRYKFEDLAPISMISISSLALITQPDRAWNSLQDAFDEAKAKNLTLKVGVMDARSRTLMERLAKEAGVRVALVPQQGGTPILTGILGRHMDLGILGTIAVENSKAGKIKVLASLGGRRIQQLPEIPTLIEQGVQMAPFDATLVLFTKKGVPDEIINKLSAVMLKLMEKPEYKKLIIEANNTESIPGGREYASKFLRDSYERLAAEHGAKK